MADPEAKPTAPSRELVRVQAAGTSGSRSPELFDAAVGVAASTTVAAVAITREIARLSAPLGHALLHPPLVPERLHPARLVAVLAVRGRGVRTTAGDDFERLLAAMIPVVVREVLDTLDLNAIVAERIDIDGLIATVDIAGVIERVDLDAVVERIDINAIAKRIDIDGIVARIDLDAIVSAVDLNAIIDRLNMVDIAEDVINEIDLPEIIRNSTGSMASQVVRDARMQSIGADEAISHLIDRLLRRRGARSTIAPHQPPVVPQSRVHDEEPLR